MAVYFLGQSLVPVNRIDRFCEHHTATTHTNPDRAIPTSPSAVSRSRHGSGCRPRWRRRPSKVCDVWIDWFGLPLTRQSVDLLAFIYTPTRVKGECHICQDEITAACAVTRLPCGRHHYHASCVGRCVKSWRPKTCTHPISQHHPLSRPPLPPTHMAGGCRLQPVARTAGSKSRSPSPRRRRTSSRRLDEEGERKGSRRKWLKVEEEGCVRLCTFVRL